MFEKFQFNNEQIEKYYSSALRDLRIAEKVELPEVVFRFSYDSLIKLAIAVCAINGMRVKARQGHHVELIAKLAEILKEKDIEILANDMRSKRNIDLYSGGLLITDKDSQAYLKWISGIFAKSNKYFKGKSPKLF